MIGAWHYVQFGRNAGAQQALCDAPLNVLLDPLRDRPAAGVSVDLLALALAAWLRRMSGRHDGGRPLHIQHPLSALLREKAVPGGSDPRPLPGIGALFGDVGRDARLIEAVGRWSAASRHWRHGDAAARCRVAFQLIDCVFRL
jgi:mannitol-1-phosphate/altronate dehydrogenase